MYYKKQRGNIGEEIATKYLKEKKYIIMQRNFLIRTGEIDIIAKDIESNEVVFIEVKTRTTKKYGNPIDAIDAKKMKHIYQTAMYYINKNHLEEQVGIRFDAVEVYLLETNIKIKHIKNII